MGVHKYDKLNKLQQILPEGLPVDSNWLQRQGYSRQLIAKYVQHGWLVSPVRGVYQRDSSLVDSSGWEPVVVSLQSLLDIRATVGGRTALELQGLSHYLPMRARSDVHLYCSDMPPTWVSKMPVRQHFVLHSTRLFSGNDRESKNRKEFQQASVTEQPWGTSNSSIFISTPERAILEALDELPMQESFHQADVFMEGLTNLRPQFLNILLANCRSIKTKRLFLWFARRHNHAWLKAIDTEKIDLGKGKRMIVRGGKLDTQYLITVPEEFASAREQSL